MILFGLGTFILLTVHWTLVPRPARRGVFMGFSGAVLACFAPLSLGTIGALSILTYGLLKLDGTGSRRGWAALAATICLGALAAYKYIRLPLPAHGFLEGGLSSSAPKLVGVSYAVFRLISVAIDYTRGTLRLGGLPSFLEYAAFPPTFLSGPIERLDSFRRNYDDSALGLDALFWGTRRILFGLSKKVFLVPPLLTSAEGGFEHFVSLTTAEAWGALLCYSLFIYLDFSAYCDLALGIARLFGYKIMENFRWPYLSANITEFWRNWHISLSTWLRDYVYLPLSVGLTHIPVLRPRPLLMGALSTFTTMVVCGLWHGETLSFALWGAGHGLLLVGHQFYRWATMRWLTPAQRRALSASPICQGVDVTLTFVSVSLLWVLFRFSPREAGLYWLRLIHLK